MNLSETLEQSRRRLFDRFRTAEGPIEWLQLQIRIAGAVLRAERQREVASKKDRSELGLHVQLCRAYGDAIVWRTIHSHAIRHHSALPGRAPHLGGIRDQLRQYATFAHGFAEWGLPAILPDLTNIWRLGDVLVVGDPESPEVVEFKGSQVILPARLKLFLEAMAGNEGLPLAAKADSRPLRGRAARQTRSIRSRYAYLIAERGRLPGDEFDRVAIGVPTPTSYLYGEIGQAVEQALAEGYGEQVCSPFQMLVAVRADYVFDDNLPPRSFFLRDAQAPTVDVNLRPNAPLWWVAPPPTEWDLGLEATWALMEGNVVLVHMIDLAAFENFSGDGIQFRVVEEEEGRHEVTVRAGEYDLQLGDKFFWDLIFGFERLESVASRARAFILEFIAANEAERASRQGQAHHDP